MSAVLLSGINRVAFTIGSLPIRWYGLIIVLAMILGLIYICVECKRINLNADDAIELFLWLIPLAIIFARVFYVMVRPQDYFPWHSWDDFVNTINISNGGITIIGGIFGGIIGGLIFAYRKRKKCNFGQVADLLVPPLLMGQIIGRLGNFVNQEAFGIPILDPKFQTFPFAVYIDDPSGLEKADKYIGEGWYAAAFFYEMVWNFIGWCICYGVWRKNKKYPGILLIFYIFWYFLGRGLLEFIRLDAVPITQILCFVAVPAALLVGIAYMAVRSSELSFHKVDDAVKANLLTVTELSEYDVKNYKFVCRVFENKKNPLRLLYRFKDFCPVEIEAMDYIEIDKRKKEKNEDEVYYA